MEATKFFIKYKIQKRGYVKSYAMIGNTGERKIGHHIKEDVGDLCSLMDKTRSLQCICESN